MEYDNQNTERRLTKREKRELRRQEKETMRAQTQSRRSVKRAMMWVSVIVVLGLVVFGMVKLISSSQNNGGGEGAVTLRINENDWVQGNKNASTTIVEYSDFQCPACAAYRPLVTRMMKDLGSKIRFVYRHFPLQQHQNADLAARAAEAAGKQGKFWEMHDILFENQTMWAEKGNAEEIFLTYAKDLGLVMDQFKRDINSKYAEDKIQKDLQSGFSIGVNSTPSFFVNGIKMRNPRGYEEFKSIIEQSIQSAR